MPQRIARKEKGAQEWEVQFKLGDQEDVLVQMGSSHLGIFERHGQG